MKYYPAFKKEILPFALKWMNLVDIKLNDISQAERDKYCMVSLQCEVFFLKKVELIGTE